MNERTAATNMSSKDTKMSRGRSAKPSGGGASTKQQQQQQQQQQAPSPARTAAVSSSTAAYRPPLAGPSLIMQSHVVIPTGSFAHRSPMASRPHDPLLCLASHCLRTAFGESVQMVADALQATGGCRNNVGVTLKQLWTTLYRVSQQQQTITSDNGVISGHGGGGGGGFGGSTVMMNSNMSPMNNKKALRIKEESIVRASLLVLIQHSIVTMKRQRLSGPTASSGSKRPALSSSSSSSQPPIYLYQYHPERAIRLSRYAKYIEYIKKALDLTAAGVVETLLLHGRCRTIDLVVRTVEANTLQHDARYTAREMVVDAMVKLANGGFLERILPFGDDDENGGDDDDDEDAGETEFESESKTNSTTTKEPPTKRVRLNIPPSAAAASSSMPTSWKDLHHDDQQGDDSEDPAVLKLIKSHAHYKHALPVDAVWRVNQTMFHHSSRAYCLGRLVGQLVGAIGVGVQAAAAVPAGSLVTAALKYRAHLEHVVQHPANTLVLQVAAAAAGGTNNSVGNAADASNAGGGGDARQSYNVTFFTARDIVKYLPKTVLQVMEKKKSSASSSGGGSSSAASNANVVRCIHQALVQLADQHENKDLPVIVRRVGDDKFEIAHASLTDFLRRRIIHQVILDRHGEVAARIVSILCKQGWLESETLADFAMVQAKDTRSVLHELYRSRYIELFLLAASSSGRQPHNPATANYLWSVHKDRLLSNITQDVAMSCWNIRLRRQHESQIIGKDWIERAQQAHDMDENEHERDKINSQKFCAGLERLDVALQQLDETLMVLCDF